MKKIFAAVTALTLLVFSFQAQADDRKATAENLVKAAIAHYQKVGEEQAYADFSKKDSEFFHGEFYIFVMSAETGSHVYHAVNEKLVGKNLLGLKDTSGKLFVKELYENANKQGATWTTYQWPHPQTKKIEPKVVYTEKHGNLLFSTGYYE
ncbi:cache domain-containing protein [Sneathiella glossodoripedis]|uniref:cache domain-containing protein n=1 Tax=Sneathiella glossodoripedis TaxID=418853 RepID=UPI00046EDBC1|nr:cache domain-containing protein [Sneathiella glossodoripedis]